MAGKNKGTKKLNEQQEKFCIEYIKTLNCTKAALAVGYSKKTATSQGSRLLTKVEIQERLSELRAELQERLKCSAEDVLSELIKIGFSNIQDFLGADGKSFKNLNEMDKNLTAAVESIQYETKTTTIGESINVTETVKLKLHDKIAGLTNLGRHFGIFEKDNKTQALVIKVTRS